MQCMFDLVDYSTIPHHSFAAGMLQVFGVPYFPLLSFNLSKGSTSC